MNSFPTIQNPSQFDEEPEMATTKVRLGTKMAGRPNWTKKICTFTIGWNELNNTDKETLLDFILDNSGVAFTFTHPTTGNTHTVMVVEDKIKYSPKNVFGPDGKVCWSVSFSMTEV